ncbi:MAG: type II and III secretion system protein, partial [Planctomycetota bacterium]|nr:type II and III secretion system protein [Planctomycetota bacterium]
RYDNNNQPVDIIRPVVEQREIGTTVRIRPSINADGTITMRFYLELSLLGKGGNIYLVRGNAQEATPMPVDTVDTKKLESIVVASHEQAVVMGGLIAEKEAKDRSRVPLLGDIPGMGSLFSHRRTAEKARTETIIIVIPHIIGAASLSQQASEGVLKDNVTHPWATEGRTKLTDYDPRQRRIESVNPPPDKTVGKR